MSCTVVYEEAAQMQKVCGINDRNIPYLELLLRCSLFVHGNRLVCEANDDSPEDVCERFQALLLRLQELAREREVLSEAEIFMEFQALQEPRSSDQEPAVQEPPLAITVSGRSVFPKTLHQRQMIRQMREKQVVFSIGPAGTGKTFLAVAQALSEVLGGNKQKIILTRPVVEAGESLGYLPGDLTQKIAPYLRPLYDAMEYLLPPAIIRRLEDNGAVEVAPLAYMRGRSLNNAFVILDEAQNTTIEQMKMFLTRLNENSKAVITGDITQIDLPRGRLSGLIHASQILRDIEDLAFVRFSSTDVVRSRIVQRIVDAYEKETNSDL